MMKTNKNLPLLRGTKGVLNPPRPSLVREGERDLKIKALLCETVNYGVNAGVFFDVELKDGSIERIDVAQLFTDREFIGNCSRELYGHLCHRKGYMMGRV